jgi:hypothetical protein
VSAYRTYYSIRTHELRREWIPMAGVTRTCDADGDYISLHFTASLQPPPSPRDVPIFLFRRHLRPHGCNVPYSSGLVMLCCNEVLKRTETVCLFFLPLVICGGETTLPLIPPHSEPLILALKLRTTFVSAI